MNDNNRPAQTTPSGGNPFAGNSGAPPPSNKPLFVSEEEHAPPPPPVGTPSADTKPPAPIAPPALPPLPTLGTSAPPLNSTPSPKLPVPPVTTPLPPAGGGSSGDGEDKKKNSGSILPPIVEAPKKKSRAKLFAGLAAVLLLVLSIPLVVFVIGQNTELRERASAGEWRDDPAGAPEGYTWEASCGSSECSQNSDCPSGANGQEGWCYGFESGFRCLQLVQNQSTPTPQNFTCNSVSGQYCTADRCGNYGDISGSGTCPDFAPTCCSQAAGQATPTPTTGGGTGGGSGTTACPGIENAGPLVHAGTEGINLGNQTYAPCNVVTDFVSRYNTYAGRAWAVERVCNDSVPAASDGQNLITQSEAVVAQYLSQGRNGCQAWVTAHNAELTGGGAGTTANQCTGVRIYKYPYNINNEVSAPFNGKLAEGDPIKVCLITSGSGGRPEVAFGGTQNWEFAGETGPRNEACRQYDIPAGAVTLRFEARY